MEEQEASRIFLPIRLTKEDIDSKINQMIVGVVYEDTNWDDDGFMFKAKKIKDIKVEVDNNFIRYQVPLSIWLKKDIGLTNVEAEGEIVLDFSSEYKINSDWHLSTKTEVLNFTWLKKPKVKLALFDIPVKFIADKILKRSKEVISKSIDQQLALKINLRQFIEKAWNILQSPFLISKEYDLWIKISPELLSVSPLKVEDSVISSKVFIEAMTNAFMGEQPVLENAMILPEFNYSDFEKDHFSIQMGVDITYAEAESIAQKNLIGKTFDLRGHTVKIENIELQEQNGKLAVNARLSGAYNGVIKMTGIPIYNSKANLIEFEDFEYELSTKNVFMKSLGWLFQQGIENQFKKAMKFPLKDYLDKAHQMIQERLIKYEVAKNVILKGEIKTLGVHQISLTRSHIKVILFAQGNLNLIIQNESL